MNKQIILYTLVDCDRCKLVKQMLDTHNVSYELIDDKQELIKQGFLEDQFPIIKVDGVLIKSYVDILGWLRKNNYYLL